MNKSLKATILMDNAAAEGLVSEWGFSVYIEYGNTKILLDSGSSEKYAENADALSIDLSKADFAVLSHAHFDHSYGFDPFFEENLHAPLYLSSACAENCYEKEGDYIGIPKDLLSKYKDRTICTDGLFSPIEGVWIVPHIKNDLELIGEKAGLCKCVNGRMVADDFDHEISLVFDTEKGLVVFNSCSHGGLPNILNDIRFYLPDKKVYAAVGGLHLFCLKDDDVRDIAGLIKNLGISRVITGHCTGEKAMTILKRELGEMVESTYAGLLIEF